MNTNHVTHNLQLSAWANRIREQQVSGLNIKAWCYQNHFTKDQYYYWKRLLKEACLEARLPEIVQVPLPIVEECCSTCTTITPPSTPSTADGDLYAAKELSSAVPQSTPTSSKRKNIRLPLKINHFTVAYFRHSFGISSAHGRSFTSSVLSIFPSLSVISGNTVRRWFR